MLFPDAVDPICRFAVDIGVRVHRISSSTPKMKSFRPGVWIIAGELHVDPPRLVAGTDLLHELGHIAVTPAWVRPSLGCDVDLAIAAAFDLLMQSPDVQPDAPQYRYLMQAGDQETLAWEFPAALAIGVDPRNCFYAGSLTTDPGQSPEESAAHTFSMIASGRHFGVHGLWHADMAIRRQWPKMNRFAQI